MIAMSMLVLASVCAPTEVPALVTVTAYLEEDGAPVDDEVSARFTFFDAAEGGSPVWSETHAGLVVEGGVLAAELGSRADNPITPDVFSGARWLEIVVNDVVLSPRARAASVPFALTAARAEVCESVGGMTVDDIDAIAAAATAPISRVRIAGPEVALYVPAAGCEPLGASLPTLSSTCTSVPCNLGNSFAHRRCDGSCGASSPEECANTVVGWLLSP